MDFSLYLIAAAVLLGLGSWCLFIWAARTGQFRDVEDAKFRMLEIERAADGPNTPPSPAREAKEVKDHEQR